MQNKILIFLFLFLVNSISFGQDTIFTTRNPEGLIVKEWQLKRKTYSLQPIDGSMLIVTPSKQLKSISYANGSTEINSRFKVNDDIVLSSNNRTGKIELKDSIFFKTKSKEEVLAYIQDFTTSNENIEFKRIEGNAKAQYIGRYELYFERVFYNVYFILRFDLHGKEFIHSQSNFVMIRERLNNNWLTEGEILNLKENVLRIEDYYYSISQTYKIVFWKSLDKNMQFIDAEIKRFIVPEEKQAPLRALPKDYSNIVFNDSMVMIDGTIIQCKVDSISKKKINYYQKVNERVVYQKTPFKRVYQIKKIGENPAIYSHKFARRKGEFTINDKNGLLIDFTIGAGVFSGRQKKYDDILGAYYKVGFSSEISLAVGVKIGYRKYFNKNSSHKYSPGIQIFTHPKMIIGELNAGEIPLLLGFTNLIKISPTKSIELNANVGVGVISYGVPKTGPLNFGPSIGSKPAFFASPVFKIHNNKFTVGLMYSWAVGWDSNPTAHYTNLQLHSLLFTLGRVF